MSARELSFDGVLVLLLGLIIKFSNNFAVVAGVRLFITKDTHLVFGCFRILMYIKSKRSPLYLLIIVDLTL